MTGNFEGRKLIVVGGSSGMGKATAASVIADGGSAVIIGRDQGRVDETVAELGKQGKAWGITADLADQVRSTPSSGSWPRRTRTHHSWLTPRASSSRGQRDATLRLESHSEHPCDSASALETPVGGQVDMLGSP
jgi:hypothetical protein